MRTKFYHSDLVRKMCEAPMPIPAVGSSEIRLMSMSQNGHHLHLQKVLDPNKCTKYENLTCIQKVKICRQTENNMAPIIYLRVLESGNIHIKYVHCTSNRSELQGREVH